MNKPISYSKESKKEAPSLLELQKINASLAKQLELQEVVSRLQQSRQEVELILSSIPDGIFLIAQDGSISLCNPKAKDILGIPQDYPIANKPFSSIFPDSFFGFSLSQALTNLPNPKTVAITLEDSSSSKNLEIFVKRCETNHQNLHPYLFLLIRDRSQYKQMENALDNYQTMTEIGKMATTLAHEIRNPLTGIEGFATILREELSSPRHQKMIQSIVDGTRSLNTLVSSILEYTKPNPLNLKSTNLAEFLLSLIPLLEASFPTCSLNLENRNIVKSLDLDRMRSVIWNLVKNGFEASFPNTPVILSLSANGEISICNEGNDIPENIQAKLFTPLFTTKSSGNGLGLAEAKKVVSLHGGFITVNSANKKTIFTISLP